MISIGQIVSAGVITAVSVAIASAAVHWRMRWILACASSALFLMIAWRLLCNAFGLNGDFVPAISAGDVGCLLVGAIAPTAIAMTHTVPARLRWVPPATGALVGFLVNVVIL